MPVAQGSSALANRTHKPVAGLYSGTVTTNDATMTKQTVIDIQGKKGICSKLTVAINGAPAGGTGNLSVIVDGTTIKTVGINNAAADLLDPAGSAEFWKAFPNGIPFDTSFEVSCQMTIAGGGAGGHSVVYYVVTHL